MANIPITHQKVGVDYVGGVATNSQTLFAGDWNAVHFTLSAGSGISIVSDGAIPPTITFSLGGVGGLTISGSVSAGTGFQTNSTATATSFLLSNGVGFGIP